MRNGRGVQFLALVALAVVALAAGSAGADATWTAAVTVAESGTANSTALTFGVNPTATTGIDAGLNEVEQPPSPPAGNWEAKWIAAAPFTIGNGLTTNLAPGVTTIAAYTMRIGFQRAGTGDVTFTWNQTNVTARTTSCVLRDATGTILNVDMRGAGTATLTAQQIDDNGISNVRVVFTSIDPFVPPPDHDRLIVDTTPANPTSGAAMTLVVSAQDGAAARANGVSITVAKLAGAGTLTGTLTRSTTGGAATFSDLVYTATADQEVFTIRATANDYQGNPISVTTANITSNVVATKLIFSTQPAGSVSGVALTTQPVVRGTDANNTTDTGFTGAVDLSEASAGTLSGTVSLAAVAGVATFTNVAYTATADQQAFVLTAASAGVTSAVANSVTSDVVATKLVYTTAPTGAYNATAMLTQPVVAAQNAGNITDTGFTGNVTISATGTGTLSGTVVRAAVAGVATFTNVQYDVLVDGNTFTLTAAAAGLTSVTSGNITGSILPAPTLTAVPAANPPAVQNQRPLLTWTAVPVAASYQIDVGAAPACESVANDVAVAGTSYQVPVTLADGNYCWRVRSVGGTGNLSPYSANSTFTTVPTFGEWGLILLVLSMVGGGVWYLRQRRVAQV